MGVFQKFFCICHFSVISTSVPNFIEKQNTWCNPFTHLAWNDPAVVQNRPWIFKLETLFNYVLPRDSNARRECTGLVET